MSLSDSDYRLVLLPGKCPPNFPYKHLYNAAYEHWKATWSRIFARRGEAAYFNPYDFMRQDFVSTVFSGDEVVAQDLSTFFSLQTGITFDAGYFSLFRDHALDFMREQNVREILTVEYISVSPKYSTRKSGVPFGDVVLGLGLKLVDHFKADATTGMPRRIVGVDEMGRRYGYRTIGGQIQKAGLGLDLVVGLRGELREHPEERWRKLIDRLWNERMDTTALTSSGSALSRYYYCEGGRRDEPPAAPWREPDFEAEL